MSDPTQNEFIVSAYKAARPPRAPRWRALLRLIIFHIITVGTVPVYLPIALLRAALPFLRPHKRMTFASALTILMVRFSIKLMVLTRFQPLPPRENGWREQPGMIGATLAMLNMSGPGSRVAHPVLAAKAAKKIAHDQKHGNRRSDRVWYDAPPLPYYRGILSLKVSGRRTAGGSIAGARRVTDCSTYNGPAMVDVSWAKARTRGFWFLPNGEKQHPPERQQTGQKEPVILYFHGGAAVTFSAGDMFMGQTLATNLARSSKMTVFSVDYNLAPYAPFPIPLVQALGGWLYLINELGYRPDQIFIGGDSFGAHLTLQLERFLRLEVPHVRDPADLEKQQSLGESGQAVCAGLLLLSPWVSTVDASFSSRPNNVKHDIISLKFGDWGLKSMKLGPEFVDSNTLDLVDPWLSPVNKDKEEYAQLPAMFYVNGGVEVLVDEGKEFVRRAREAKADISHVIVPLQPHDFFTLPSAIGPSCKIYTQFGQWARKQLNSSGYKV